MNKIHVLIIGIFFIFLGSCSKDGIGDTQKLTSPSNTQISLVGPPYSLTFSWNQTDQSVDHYKIVLEGSSLEWSNIHNTSFTLPLTPQTSFLDLQDSTMSSFVVLACHKDNTYDTWPEKITPINHAIISGPQNLSIDTIDGKATISWKSSEDTHYDSIYYQVFRKTQNLAGIWSNDTLIATLDTTTTYTDSIIPFGRQTIYSVMINFFGITKAQTWGVYTGDTLGIITNFTYDTLNGKINLTWQKPQGFDTTALTYAIYRSDSLAGEYQVVADTGRSGDTKPFYNDDHTSEGLSYYYKIKVYDTSITQSTSLSQPLEAHRGALISAKPQPPILSTYSGGAPGRSVIEFTPSKGARHYNIYRSTYANKEFHLYASNITLGSSCFEQVGSQWLYVDTVVSSPNCYKAVAINEFGISDTSDSAWGIVENMPSIQKPSIVASKGVDSMVHITWDAIRYAGSYEIFRHTKHNETNTTKIATLQDTLFVDSTLQADDTAFYQVVAVSGGGVNIQKSDTSWIDSGWTTSTSSTSDTVATAVNVFNLRNSCSQEKLAGVTITLIETGTQGTTDSEGAAFIDSVRMSNSTKVITLIAELEGYKPDTLIDTLTKGNAVYLPMELTPEGGCPIDTQKIIMLSSDKDLKLNLIVPPKDVSSSSFTVGSNGGIGDSTQYPFAREDIQGSSTHSDSIIVYDYVTTTGGYIIYAQYYDYLSTPIIQSGGVVTIADGDYTPVSQTINIADAKGTGTKFWYIADMDSQGTITIKNEVVDTVSQ